MNLQITVSQTITSREGNASCKTATVFLQGTEFLDVPDDHSEKIFLTRHVARTLFEAIATANGKL
jgi:hypothetical protein